MGFWKKFLKVFGIIFLVFIILAVIAFFFAPIKMSKNGFNGIGSNIICYSKTNITDTRINCVSAQQCIQLIKERQNALNQLFKINTTEEKAKDDFSNFLEKATICEETCKIRMVKGLLWDNVDSCLADEESFAIQFTPYNLFNMYVASRKK